MKYKFENQSSYLKRLGVVYGCFISYSHKCTQVGITMPVGTIYIFVVKVV